MTSIVHKTTVHTNNNTTDYLEPLKAYTKVFEKLSNESLESELAPMLDEHIFFKDPFNQVTGKKLVLQVFEHMFSNLYSPKFVIKHIAIADKIGYLHWDFHFSLSKGKPPQNIDGMSQVVFNSKGLIQQHIDYWDSSEYIYSQIPLLGWIIGQIKKRLTAN